VSVWDDGVTEGGGREMLNMGEGAPDHTGPCGAVLPDQNQRGPAAKLAPRLGS
jgi:hypothetical protein